MFDLNGKNILNAEFPEYEGKNLWNFKDKKGTYPLREIKSKLNKKNEIYYEWYWYKNKDKSKEYKKIGFFKKHLT